MTLVSKHPPQLGTNKGWNNGVVVIGAGTLGLYLAKLLVDRGTPVTVVESGTAVLEGFSSDSYACIGKPHRGIVNGRSRSIGGASNLWGGQLVEFQPRDFRAHAALPTHGWPITFEELQPYYTTTFERLGIPTDAHQDGPIWQAAIGEYPELSAGVELFLTRWMKTPSMAVMYAGDIQSNPQLEIYQGWHAVGFESQASAVSHVVVRNRSGETALIPGSCFVVAAGTIETVRLLLATASDERNNCPWAFNQMLGRRFQDHLGGRLGVVHPTDRKRLFRYFSTVYSRGLKFQPKLRLNDAIVDDEGLLSVQAWLTFDSSVSEHLVYLKQFLKAAIHSRQFHGIHDFLKHAVACARHLPPLMWTYIKDHRIYVPFDSRISLSVQAEQRPLDESVLALNLSNVDEYGLPQLVLDWRIGGNELKSIRELAVRFDKALRAAGLGWLDIEPDLLECHPRFLDTLFDAYHAAGGAIMGETEKYGVVDKDLRVFGTSNLYLASAAVLPTSSSANITFTTLALATRLADHLS